MGLARRSGVSIAPWRGTLSRHSIDTRTTARASGRRKPRPVLLVLEDDPSARDLLVDLGGDAGWDVRGTRTVDALRDALREDLPDLLIIDDDVADGRSGDVARELRAGGRTRDLPILIFADGQPRRRAELAKLASVLPKPFDLTDLERRMAQVAASRRGGRSQQRAS
jgi:DNA-binding response OmpR family regulator